jgi:hypothetical protein
MLYLLIAILAFFLGVLVHPILHGKTRLLAFMDAGIVLAVLALVGFSMLPHTLAESGALGLLSIAIGFGLTFGLDQVGKVHQNNPARPWAVAALVGALLAHGVFDGAALSLPEHHHGGATNSVVIGILLHRLPLGMVVHHLLGPKLKIPLIVAGFIALSTAFGFFYTDQVLETQEGAQHLLEAFVVGMLIQVVVAHLGSLKKLKDSTH